MRSSFCWRSQTLAWLMGVRTAAVISVKARVNNKLLFTLGKSQPIITAHRSTTRVPVGLACSTNVANRSNVRDQEDCVEIEVRL